MQHEYLYCTYYGGSWSCHQVSAVPTSTVALIVLVLLIMFIGAYVLDHSGGDDATDDTDDLREQNERLTAYIHNQLSDLHATRREYEARIKKKLSEEI